MSRLCCQRQRGTEASAHRNGTRACCAPGIWAWSRSAAAAASPESKRSGRLLQATLCETVLNVHKCPVQRIYSSELDGTCQDSRRVEVHTRVGFGDEAQQMSLPAVAMIRLRVTRSAVRAATTAAQAAVDAPSAAQAELLTETPAGTKTARKRKAVAVTPKSTSADHGGTLDRSLEKAGTEVVAITTVRVKKVKARQLQPSMPEEAVPGLRVKAARIYDQLMVLYKDPPCPLDHTSPYQLLVCVVLSAQARRHVLDLTGT